MKKSLKVKFFSILSIFFGLAGLQASVAIFLLFLSDLGAPQAAAVYPLEQYPTTAWWVYALLIVAAIILFSLAVYCDDLGRREEQRIIKKFLNF